MFKEGARVFRELERVPEHEEVIPLFSLGVGSDLGGANRHRFG